MRYRHWLVSVAVLALALSCREERALAVPEEKLVLVLVDIHLAEAMAQKLYGETKDTLSAKYYQQIYTIHGITREQFDRAYQQLEEDPPLMFTVYEQVLEELNRKEAQVK